MITRRMVLAAAPDLLNKPPEWMQWGECQYVDPELFFPEKGKSTAAAKRVCAVCDVRAECLAFALETNDPHGVYGGLAPKERWRLKKITAA